MSVRATRSTLAVLGAHASAMRTTTALNLAAALSRTGRDVALCDGGAVAAALGVRAGSDVALPGRGAGAFALVGSADDPRAAASELLVLDTSAAAVGDALHAARVLLVPVDASALDLRAVESAAALARSAGGATRLRVVLARTLPRGVDRWSLVEEIDAVAPGALYGSTVPVTRRVLRTDGAEASPAPVLLYARGTRAARAYAALAAEVLADLA